MSASDAIVDLLVTLAANPFLAAAAIVVATLALEDAATVAVGILVARAAISVELALAALIVGTICGDMALHCAGRFAGRASWVRRRLEHRNALRARAWIDRWSIAALAFARFVPGMRLPVYLGSAWSACPYGDLLW